MSRYMPLSLMTMRPSMTKPQAYETEVIDKLFLELSQVTRATTGKELRLTERLAEVSARAEKAEQTLATVAKNIAGSPATIIEWSEKVGNALTRADTIEQENARLLEAFTAERKC